MSVFSLHTIRSEEPSTLPFPPKDYARFKFGDDAAAHRFGSQLAQAFIAENLGNFQDSSSYGVLVAAASTYIPGAAHALRHHFVAHLNRHLITTDCRPAQKLDIYRDHGAAAIAAAKTAAAGTRPPACHDPTQSPPEPTFHLAGERTKGRTVIVVDDVRTTPDHEEALRRALQASPATTPAKLFFVYLAQVADPAVAHAIAASLAAPHVSARDVEAIAQGRNFVMSCACVEFVLLLEHVDFCRFIRRQDDGFVRLLLDYAIGGLFHVDGRCLENFKFLLWETKAREFSA